MASRRRRFRPRRSEAPSPPAAAAPRPTGRRSRLGVALTLLVGYWIGRFATFVPADALPVLDIAAALLSAVLFAVWYRRGARRYLDARQAARQRSGASGSAGEAADEATE